MSQPTIVAVLVTRIYDSYLSTRVKECGRTFRYDGHVTTPAGISLRVACLCPEGHGVNRLPWNGWLDAGRGKYDLADIEAPQRPALLSTEVPDEIDYDEIDNEVEVDDEFADEGMRAGEDDLFPQVSLAA